MLERAGDHERHAGERAAAFFKGFVQFDHLQQIIQDPALFWIREERQKGVGHDLADPFDLQQILAAQAFDRDPTVPAELRDQASVGGADTRDSEAVQETLHRRVSCALRGRQQILEGFLAEALHCGDPAAQRFQPEEIGRLADQAVIDKFFECHLRKALDVHRVTAHEMHQPADLFRQAIRVRAVQGLHAVFVVDRGRMAADRTGLRDRHIIAAGQVFGDLRNDHICLIYADRIADA